MKHIATEVFRGKGCKKLAAARADECRAAGEHVDVFAFTGGGYRIEVRRFDRNDEGGAK